MIGEVFGSIWWLLVTLGLLVTFHEFGHFWVARRLGVKVLRFSVGFGRSLWSRTARDGTEYVLAAIPLGGYVKMLDEREGDVDPKDLALAFNRKPVLSRIAIVAAGPVFNLIFAVFAFWLMFLVGKPDYQPIVGRVDGIALASGFERGDRIVGVAGEAVATWTDAQLLLARHAVDRAPVAVDVQTRDGAERRRTLALDRLPATGDLLGLHDFGLFARHILLPAVVGSVAPDSPGARAGLRPDDRIVAIDDEPIEWYQDVSATVQRLGAGGRELVLTVQRGTDQLRMPLTPAPSTDDGPKRLVIGFSGKPATSEYDTVRQYGPVDAIGHAFQHTWFITRETLGLLKRMLIGTASLKNVSGPISIAQFANASAMQGPGWYLFFLGVLSLSIAIMNLLPIPILDGGHLLYYLIELFKGSPVSERVVIAGQYVGLGLLALLMGLAFYNDILRIAS